MTLQPSDKAEPSELDRFLKAHPDIRYVDALFVDLCGIVRGKRFPREHAAKIFRSGVQIAHTVYLLDVTGLNADPCGHGFSDGDPDGTGWPVPGTVVPVPWAGHPTAQVLMSLHDEQRQPWIVDPRNVLRRVAKRFAELELSPVVALELEFYLLDMQRDATGAPQPPISPATGLRESGTQVYGMAELDAFAGFLHDVEEACRIQSIPASMASAEFAPAQYEINLQHVDDPLTAADHAALLCRVIRAVARAHNMRATFMAKPFLDQTGNGLHIHMSLLDASGRNVFDDGGRPEGSAILRHAIGGLAATMAESMAVFAPNVNAYRRFAANQFVPVAPRWSVNNRSAAFRIPTGDGASRRIEHRVSGADANPYLALAAVLAGAHHGIVNRLDPGPPSTGNAGAEMDQHVPFNLADALAAMRRGAVIADYFTPEYVAFYCETKRLEHERFMAAISPREYEWYL
jgi:glutamine synthetase